MCRDGDRALWAVAVSRNFRRLIANAAMRPDGIRSMAECIDLPKAHFILPGGMEMVIERVAL